TALDVLVQVDLRRLPPFKSKWIKWRSSRRKEALIYLGGIRMSLLTSAATSQQWNLLQQIAADGDFIRRIFRQRDADRIAQTIAKEGADADGALDPAIFAFAGFSHAEVNRIIPIRAKFGQSCYEQPIAFDHHLRIAR